MTDRSDRDAPDASGGGEDPAFEGLYRQYHQRVRLVAWRISHRRDWIDDLLNEAWCRAFDQRRTYDPERPFLVWMAGILRNVYREQCRKSAGGTDPSAAGARDRARETDNLSPETIAHEAEVLAALNDCVGRLGAEDARIVRLRFFQGKPLRTVAERVNVPESTLREKRLPDLLERLRRCLEEKKIDFSGLFSAQGLGELQGRGGD